MHFYFSIYGFLLSPPHTSCFDKKKHAKSNMLKNQLQPETTSFSRPHPYRVPRLWWWYFFPFPPVPARPPAPVPSVRPATTGMIVVRPLDVRPDFKTTRIGGGVGGGGGGGLGGGTKMISTNDDEGYEDSIYFQHQPMQPTLPHQQQLQQQHQTFGRNGGGGGGRKEPGHIYNNQ